MSKVLVVAFDGLDKELVEKYNCEYLQQEENGTIDNKTGITRIMTSELFASLITGKTHEEHGITGLRKNENKRRDSKFGRIRNFLRNNVRGFHTLFEVVSQRDESKRKYIRSDIQAETIFDKIAASKSLYVPVYSPDPLFMLGYPHKLVEYGREFDLSKETQFSTERRLKGGIGSQPGLFNLTKEFWDFVMVHLHDPDPLQDTDRGDLKQRYEELDKIAEQIVEQFEGWIVIFMSDHGRPSSKGNVFEHNENAFYSSNKELFGDETPHITDFHDKILELTGND